MLRLVQYGNRSIPYQVVVQEDLKSHYISVARGEGVLLKGKAVSDAIADRLILKKARWILDKLALVQQIAAEEIVTGARMQYLGRRYYIEILIQDDLNSIHIDFTASKFRVSTPNSLNTQADLNAAFATFFEQKAREKLSPRVRKWAKEMDIQYKSLSFARMEKRWGSCTPQNRIVLHVDAVKLSYRLIDYLIVHELAHVRIKNHSKAFWAEIARYIPNWRALDEAMGEMKF